MLDKKYNFKEKEEKWQEYWEKEDVYAFEWLFTSVYD